VVLGFLTFAVVLGVELAGLAGVVRGVMGMAGSHVAMVASRFGFAGLVCFGGVAVVLSGFFMMISSVGVMFVGVVRSHGRSSDGGQPRRKPRHS
jgi:hypothetical protein